MSPIDRLNHGLTEAPNWRSRVCSRERSGAMLARVCALDFADDPPSSTTSLPPRDAQRRSPAINAHPGIGSLQSAHLRQTTMGPWVADLGNAAYSGRFGGNFDKRGRGQ